MKKKLILITLIAAAFFPRTTRADDTIDVLAPKLQNLAVTVHSDRGEGSGTLITRNGENYVLTAGHVVSDNRKVEKVSLDGKEIINISFEPVKIVREMYNDDESVGLTTVDADVVAYSSPEYGHDIALLKLRYKVTDDSVEFFPGKMVNVGSEVVHVGSLFGQEGSNSFTTGNYSQRGRMLFNHVFDQVSCPAYPGSSGGGVYLRNGQYVGMLVRGAFGSTFNLIVPVRRIRQCAKLQHFEFIFDPKATDTNGIKLEDREPLPTEKPSPLLDVFVKFPYLLRK